MTVELYTDGSCLGNPGDGGYAAILKMGEYEKIIKDYCPNTTNNIMELMAVIAGLSSLRKKCDVVVYTDSKYVADAFNKGWLDNWMSNNWIKSDKKPVLNKELWQALVELVNTQTSVKFIWVKGHAENEYNNRCDEIARNEALNHKNINTEFEEI